MNKGDKMSSLKHAHLEDGSSRKNYDLQNTPAWKQGRPVKDDENKVPKMGTFKTAEKIANETGVSKNSVERNEEFSKGVDKAEPAFKQQILQGKAKVKKQDVREISKADPEALQMWRQETKQKPGPKPNNSHYNVMRTNCRNYGTAKAQG